MHRTVRHIGIVVSMLSAALFLVISLSSPFASNSWFRPVDAEIVGAVTSPVNAIIPCLLGQTAGLNQPRILTTCFGRKLFAGDYTVVPGVDEASSLDAAVLSYDDSKPDDTTEPTIGHALHATLGQVGAVYGAAHVSGRNPAAPTTSEHYFISSFTKRMTRYSSSGPGAIYRLNPATNTSQLLVQIPAVVAGPSGAPGNPGDGSAATFPNGETVLTYDPFMGGIHSEGNIVPGRGDEAMAPLMGTTSLGDLDVDPDERFLYTVNLHTRRVVRVDLWSATPQSSVTTLASVPAAQQVCPLLTPTQWRPFALAVNETSVYLGAVCSGDGGNNTHTRMLVHRYDIATSTWDSRMPVLPVAVDRNVMPRLGQLQWDSVNVDDGGGHMVTDIEFNLEGTMLYLGIRNRLGDIGNAPGKPHDGGLLQFARQLDGTYAITPPVFDTVVFDGEGGPAGALAVLPGQHLSASPSGATIVTSNRDTYQFYSAGGMWYNLPTDPDANPLTLDPNVGREQVFVGYIGYFGKSNGVGDIEYLCPWRKIGNRFWADENSNGIQDPGELQINGVVLELLNAAGVVISSVTTGNIAGDDGNYAFYVNPWETYSVRIASSNYTGAGLFAPGQPYADYAITSRFTGTIANDSDVNPVDRTLDVASAGRSTVNPTYDLGVTPRYSIGNRVWFDSNDNGIHDGERGISRVQVSLFAADGAGDPSGAALQTVATDASGYYRFDNLPTGTYVVTVNASNSSGTGPLVGLRSSSATTGSDSDTDLDNSMQWTVPGEPQAGGVYRSGRIQLGAGPIETTTDLDDPTAYGTNSVSGAPASDSRTNLTIDFGFYRTPTAVVLAAFTARRTPTGVVIQWQSSAESGTFGYRLYRMEPVTNTAVAIGTLIPATGPHTTYTVQDTDYQAGAQYRLLEITATGAQETLATIRVVDLLRAPNRVFLPVAQQ